VVYGLSQRLLAEICPACGLASPGGFCGVCAAELTRVVRACRRCGLAEPVAHCPRQQMAWDVDQVVAPFTYGPPLDHYVHALKYRNARALGRAFALLLYPSLALVGAVDALVAVRVLARALKVPVMTRGIVRLVATPAQAGQGALERRRSVARAFRVERNLEGLRIAIVDDVVTTGATVNALAVEVKAAGAARCAVLAVARTAEPAQRRNV